MIATPQGFQNPECYARALGGCSTRINREHYVSKGILELVYGRYGEIRKSVLVRNLAFQARDVQTRVGVGSLTAKILCETHNSLLSPFDTAGKAMFSAMDSLNDAVGNPHSPSKTLHIDGDALERWMLKTLFGGMFSGNFLVSLDESLKTICPPTEWLEILFNGIPFPTGLGLYYLPDPGAKITTDADVLRIVRLVATDNTTIMGLRVWFLGFPFVLLTARLDPGVPTIFDDASYRPAGLIALGSNTQIHFDWKDGPESEEIVFQHLGR